MRLRYSEDPAEWRKFVWASSFAPVLFALLGAWRGRWNWSIPSLLAALALVPALLACIHPAWFRTWYRAGRWFGHQMGRIMGGLLLTLLFFLVLSPIALVLRLLGQDPLQLRIDPRAPTYWIPSRPPGDFSQMF